MFFCSSFLFIRAGTKYVGPIHGRLMASTSLAALMGPSFMLHLRSMSETSAMNDLLSKVDPARFQEAFSTRLEDAQMLIDVSFGVLLLPRRPLRWRDGRREKWEAMLLEGFP